MSIKLKNIYSLDARSLGLFRIFLGLLTLCYFAQIFTNWRMYFSNQGVLPAHIAFTNWYQWSLFYWLPESLHIPLLILALVLSIFYILGLWHRPVAFLIYILLISVQHRNPATMQVGNTLHSSLLFCSFFLPLNCIWSVSDKATFRKTNFQVSSFGNILFLGQISILYFFAFIFKWNDLWIWNGEGLFTSLSYSVYIRPLGEKLLSLSALLPLLTWFTQLARLLGGVAIWFSSPKIRSPLVVLFFIVHTTFALTMTLGLFPYVCLAMWCAIIPSQWWNFRKNKQTKIVSEDPKWNKIAASAALALILAINTTTLLHPTLGWNLFHSLGLYQRWSMFAEISKEHRWANIFFKTQTGEYSHSSFFPFLNEQTWAPVSSLYPSEISRRFHEKFIWDSRETRARAYMNYVCKFLSEKGEQPKGVLIDIMGTKVEAPRLPPYKYQRLYTWKLDCL